MAYGFNSDKSRAEFGTLLFTKAYLRDYSTASPLFADINLDVLVQDYSRLKILYYTTPTPRIDPDMATIHYMGGEVTIDLNDLLSSSGADGYLASLDVVANQAQSQVPTAAGSVQATTGFVEDPITGEPVDNQRRLRLYASSATLIDSFKVYGF